MIAAHEMDLPAGSIFAGRYRIVRRLGEGDRKRTYLADDTLIPRQVAVALIKPSAADIDPDGTRREAEALALAGTHDNVVTFHDRGIAEGTEYLVFDYLSGGTLRERLAALQESGEPLPTDEVMKMGRQLARALAHVHRLGFIHRDIAPGNIWLDQHREAHLGDFDSAVSLDEAASPAGLPPTTEAYSAPEQIAGEAFDERADLYSLGAVLHECVTGRRPEQLSHTAMSRDIAARRPDAPRTLIRVISSLLSRSPIQRPASAEEVLAGLTTERAYDGARHGLVLWAESLPFPLASILWHFDGELDPGVKVDYLLKFFEALAQFRATVLLSGCLNDPVLAQESLPAWFAGTDGRPLDLRLPTFGTWAKLSKRLGKSVRGMLADGEEPCRDLFAAPDAELIEALANAEMDAILQHALARRNTWVGHGGVAGVHVLDERIKDLEELLSRARALLGWSFEAWTLLKPGQMTKSRGIFDLTATMLTGSNAAFRRMQVKVSEALDAERLYLLSEGNLRALELVPFVRVLARSGGMYACYFYNRMDATGARWVSYHFHAEPEVVLLDDDLAEWLAEMTVVAPSASTPKGPSVTIPAQRSGSRTVWSLLEEAVAEIDEPFRRSDVVAWFRRRHPDVNESTLSAHIQAATTNATNRAQNHPFGKRPPLLQRVDRGLYVRTSQAGKN
jgi:hypothetical protein